MITMAERQQEVDRQKVTDAKTSVETTIQKPPVDTNPRVSTQQALIALGALFTFGDDLKRVLAQTLKIPHPKDEEAVQKLDHSRLGCTRPVDVFDERSAADHSSGILSYNESIIAKRNLASEDLLTRFLNKLTLNQTFSKSPVLIGQEISSDWLTKSYLGPVVYKRYTETPPVITIEPVKFFEAEQEVGGKSLFSGIYYHDTNHIAISKGLNTASDADKYRLIVHEELHYAAFLGSKLQIHFISSDGELVSSAMPSLLHEGLTELHAQELTRGHRGMVPDKVDYPPETVCAAYLQSIVGADVLREAYFSGDFTEVSRIFDEKFGKGSFQQFLVVFSEDSTKGSVFLEKLFNKAGVDTADIEKNPIVVGARKHMPG
ncbi:Uncharacterised protein [Candidatus Bilamarchaeum dharawalense]|uniref:Uncharacterized protein n=1 Tax=Candidatus Bilamarchaeum dharawalense TaxID=2885759 RepID=A0A5E4LMF6_9ARCH|nr:Uncharacterised protein [Candidatus Bilamarchaeum dharawalense]